MTRARVVDTACRPHVAVNSISWVWEHVFGSGNDQRSTSSAPASRTSPSTRNEPFSTSFTAGMSHIVPDFRDNRVLKYIITHVFCPLRLPDGDDHNIRNDHYLVRAIATAAYIYSDHVDEANVPQWHSISRMLANLLVMTQSESLDRSQTISWFGSMDVGGETPSIHSISETYDE